MKMFRMFGISSHLVRSFVPRRNIFDSETEQRKETFLQNKRRFTAGHKACVLGVTRLEFLLYVVFELIIEFTEGKVEWNKMLQYDNSVSVHSCRTPFTDNLLITPKTWTCARATVVPRISPHFISKIRLWPLTPDAQLLHPTESSNKDFLPDASGSYTGTILITLLVFIITHNSIFLPDLHKITSSWKEKNLF